VLIALRSDADTVQHLIAELREHCPPLARVESISMEPALTDIDASDFEIIASKDGEARTGIVPDAATCPECLSELFDPTDRRYRYPFINCTHCGPRLSIIEAIPYDRANTSMDVFTLCSACAKEYNEPADRRFHAQPNACPDCGPRLWLEDRAGNLADGDPIAAAVEALRAGKLLAIKGIGGFHLACDAGNATAIATLRKRKHRPHKPLAMMATLTDTATLCVLDPDSRSALQSPAAPQCQPYPFTVDEHAGMQEIDPLPLWSELLRDLANGVQTPLISARFHRGLADAWASVCIAQARRHGLSTIALSGGVCQNLLLSRQITQQLDVVGMTVLQHHQLPANDGGLSYGQALVAAAQLIKQNPQER